MMEFRYVIVSGDGRSWLLQGDQQYDACADCNNVLPQLLRDGWLPVRERTLGGKDDGRALVLLKRLPETGDEDIPF